MKVKVCVFLASVLVSALMLPVATAGAATGTVCKTASGTFTFSPSVPAHTTKRISVTTSGTGTLSGCNNGVTGGTLSSVERVGNVDCVTDLQTKAATIATITWRPASKGKSYLLLHATTTETGGTLFGTVTGGRFKGTKVTVPMAWTALLPRGACDTAGLKHVVFKSTAAVHV